MGSCTCVFRKDREDKTQSCRLFVEVSMVAVSEQLTFPRCEVKECAPACSGWCGRVKALRANQRCCREQQALPPVLNMPWRWLCGIWGGEASPKPNLELWLIFCRKHEKLPWAVDSGFWVLQSWSTLVEIMTFPTATWAKGGKETLSTWVEMWLIACPKISVIYQSWLFPWLLMFWPEFNPSNLPQVSHSVFTWEICGDIQRSQCYKQYSDAQFSLESQTSWVQVSLFLDYFSYAFIAA